MAKTLLEPPISELEKLEGKIGRNQPYYQALFDWNSQVVRLRGHIPTVDERETSYQSTPDKAGLIYRVISDI